MRQPKVLLWDVDCPHDGHTYEKGGTSLNGSSASALNGRLRSATPSSLSAAASAAASSSPTLSNVTALLNTFSTVTAISSLAMWSKHLFESEATNKFFVIFISASEKDCASSSSITADVLQLTSSQLMHISHYLVVLSDNQEAWTDLVRLGAHDVGKRAIGGGELAKYQRRVSQMQTELESRAGEIKLLLGLNEDLQPYNPMRSLCTYRVGEAPDIPFEIDPKQVAKIRRELARWDFYAHDLNYDELLLAAFLMFKHAFTMNELEPDLVLPDSRLYSFVSVVRNFYHPSNPYHNFRHAIDVMQATFYILVKIRALPEFDGIILDQSGSQASSTTHFNNTLSPKHSVALLIAALGHDAGHPGVTNNVLISCQAPLAKIYNDRSVLESYHSAVLCQIASNYWPSLFHDADGYKTFVVDSILATDMAKHFDYMERFEDEDYWARKCLPNLIGCMIIKCADISNVTRTLDISSLWGRVLGEEFLDVAELEASLGMSKSTLPKSATAAAAASKSPDHQLAKGQVFFVNTYGMPLFDLLVKHFPVLDFMLDNMKDNLQFWNDRLKELQT